MGQIVALVIILIMAVFLFLPMFNLVENHHEVIDIKQRLVLSSKVLINSIQKEELTKGDEIAEDKDKFRTKIIVDKDKLLSSFYDMLRKNFPNDRKREEIISNIKVKILVQHNCIYYVIDENRWELPIFFTYDYMGETVYLNTKNNLAYFYNNDGSRVYKDVSEFGITVEEKEQIIIDAVNNVVSEYTIKKEKGKTLNINIKNKHREDIHKKMSEASFNVLEGITFFVV
ncbi:hypothetical protein JYU01_01780, partial [bacterium AH-315-L21]|nr:hypothetical protein [bacterium AH-315-L21]